MNILYSDESLIQFYYGETELLETFEIENVIESDISHNVHYAQLVEELQVLNSIKLSPKKSTISNLLALAKA